MSSSLDPTRVYLVGAHATGKTTLARWIRDRYDLPMISEVARGVLAEMEANLETLRTDLEAVNAYQAQVFERQLDMERRAIADGGSFVSDRAFCNLAYAAHHSTILAEVMGDPRLARYMDEVKRGVVFYLRPHPELVVPDGVRAGLDWEEVVRIDGMVKLLLELFAVPYVPVDCLSMQERTRLVERVLDLAGLRPAVAPRRHLSTPGLDLSARSAMTGEGALRPAPPLETSRRGGRPSGNGKAAAPSTLG